MSADVVFLLGVAAQAVVNGHAPSAKPDGPAIVVGAYTVLALVAVAQAALFGDTREDAVSAWRKLAQYEREDNKRAGLFAESLTAEMFDKIADALGKLP